MHKITLAAAYTNNNILLCYMIGISDCMIFLFFFKKLLLRIITKIKQGQKIYHEFQIPLQLLFEDESKTFGAWTVIFGHGSVRICWGVGWD